MMDVLQGIGYGIVGLAILIVIGIVVITRLGDTVGECATEFSINTSTHDCFNASNGSQAHTDPTNTAWVAGDYMQTQLSSAGLAGWIPAIVAVTVGALFLAYFMGRKR